MITVTTFTNKAANEIRSRIVAQVGPEASLVRAATFHSLCYRMVRRQGWVPCTAPSAGWAAESWLRTGQAGVVLLRWISA